MSASDWQPTASLSMLRRRAAFLQAIRQFFAARDVLEVDTPLLCASTAIDPHLASIEARYLAAPGLPAQTLFLQTSPEFAMKRLLAAGAGAIYQLGRAFRDSERGRRHNPEFTMLEWYRPGFDLEQLMAEVAELVREVAGIAVAERLSYREAFLRYADIDPFAAETEQLRTQARQLSGYSDDTMERDTALDLILTHQVEPQLGCQGGTFLHQYPPSQAALAQTAFDGTHEVAQRFELYINGIEIANGYFELTDADEQARRFHEDNCRRRAAGLREIPVDGRLLEALRSGLPACAGVALGVDRLLMVKIGATQIDEVIPFPVDRA